MTHLSHGEIRGTPIVDVASNYLGQQECTL